MSSTDVAFSLAGFVLGAILTTILMLALVKIWLPANPGQPGPPGAVGMPGPKGDPGDGRWPLAPGKPGPSGQPYAEGTGTDSPQPIDPENPPYLSRYRTEGYDVAKAPVCSCHRRKIEPGEKIMIWPIPNHPDGAVDVFCEETFGVAQQ